MEDKALLYTALFGFMGVFVTAVFTFLAAVYVNRAEKRKTAEATVETVLTKHLDFKDDVIDHKDEIIAEKDAAIADRDATIMRLQGANQECEQAHEAKDLVIRELREQLSPEKRKLDDS